MAKTILLFRVDIGFDPDRGYAALLSDPANQREKGIRGNSMEQLTSRLRHALIEEAHKKRSFPTEREAGNGSHIITPDDGDPLFSHT